MQISLQRRKNWRFCRGRDIPRDQAEPPGTGIGQRVHGFRPPAGKAAATPRSATSPGAKCSSGNVRSAAAEGSSGPGGDTRWGRRQLNQFKMSNFSHLSWLEKVRKAIHHPESNLPMTPIKISARYQIFNPVPIYHWVIYCRILCTLNGWNRSFRDGETETVDVSLSNPPRLKTLSPTILRKRNAPENSGRFPDEYHPGKGVININKPRKKNPHSWWTVTLTDAPRALEMSTACRSPINYPFGNNDCVIKRGTCKVSPNPPLFSLMNTYWLFVLAFIKPGNKKIKRGFRRNEWKRKRYRN